MDATVVKVAEEAEVEAAEEVAKASAPAFGKGLITCLDGGHLVCVAYDKHEANHMPVSRGGGTAHYLLVVGYAGAASADAAAADEEEDVRLICLHGLSRRPLVLTPHELLQSNAQLKRMKKGTNSEMGRQGRHGYAIGR